LLVIKAVTEVCNRVELLTGGEHSAAIGRLLGLYMWFLNRLFYSFQAKRSLIQSIDKFIQEKIVLAGVAISETYARTKINDGDVILTYAWCV